MRTVLAVLLLALVVAGVLLAIAFSGGYNVAATQPDGPLTRWTLSTIADRSIGRHAREVGAMPDLDSAALVRGLDHFHAMCVDCHGAPGFERNEVGEGLSPAAPDLSEVVEAGEWSDAELFWIVKNGIKMTGMPAFGPTHGDGDLWSIVAIVKQLPELSDAEYGTRIAELRASAAPREDGMTEGPMSPARVHVHEDGREHTHE